MSNNFNRNLHFIKEISIIKFKSIKEYKTNLYLNLFANVAFTITLGLSYYILHKNFKDIFYWNIYEYIFYFLLLELFLFLFVPWFRYLYRYLLSGEFNNFLVRPVNPFVNYAFSSNKYFDMITSGLYIIYIFIFFIFFIPDVNILKFITVIIFGIFGGLMYMSINCFIDSLAFFMKNNRQLKSTYFSSTNFFSNYPASFFKKSNTFLIVIFMANTYYAAWTTDFYFNYISFNELLFLFIPCFFIIIFLFSLSYFLWKTGLKKYEAFG